MGIDTTHRLKMVFFAYALKKFHHRRHDRIEWRDYGKSTRCIPDGDRLHTEILQEFLGLQFLIDMILDELGKNGLTLTKRLLRELQPAYFG